jgi:hypothetical protein
VEAGRRIFTSDTRWTVVRGSKLEEGQSQGLPTWSRHVGDPILKRNIMRRVDFALFMMAALENDALVHQAPAIAGFHAFSDGALGDVRLYSTDPRHSVSRGQNVRTPRRLSQRGTERFTQNLDKGNGHTLVQQGAAGHKTNLTHRRRAGKWAQLVPLPPAIERCRHHRGQHRCANPRVHQTDQCFEARRLEVRLTWRLRCVRRPHASSAVGKHLGAKTMAFWHHPKLTREQVFLLYMLRL